MPPFRVSVRTLLSTLAASAAFAVAGAWAQQPGVFPYRWIDTPPLDAIQPLDVREALVWTGHLPFALSGQGEANQQQAVQSWQKAQGHKVTGKLTDDETRELVGEGLKERDAVGWSVLRDQAVGVAVGFPSKYLTFGPPQINGSALVYGGSGEMRQTLSVQLGSPNCRSMPTLYQNMSQRAAYKARGDNWFVARFDRAETTSFIKATCHANGLVLSELSMPLDMARKHPGLFSAMAASVTLLRIPDPTVRPRPRVEELQQSPRGFSDEISANPAPKPKTNAAAKTPAIDESGRTSALRLEARSGPDLRTDEVFEKVSGAVYVVKADKRMGSAVAISDRELLTNCHVLEEVTEVKLARAKNEMTATVVSRNPDSDRCVLRTSDKLPTWVSVRPYDDVRVGERAITIGTPQGLELTAAEGIVSSKRTYNNARVIQTSAPISQGSSGGGLFDARGHLLGITTFFFKAGQNLNFAVAAEEYASDRDQSAAAR